MDDYISQNAVIDVLATMQGSCTSKTALAQNSKIWKQIKKIPPADVVEVVRCKDCKFGRYDIGDRGMYCGRKNVQLDTYEDDFCSRGERKDG